MLKIYNTLTRKKTIFKPLKNQEVQIFVCGPTVYDFPHLGHARTYIVFDMIAKYLRKEGFRVFYLQNITDIDDKIIKRAKEKGVSPRKLALGFEKEYLKAMKNLKINSISKYARATYHIKEIISQVSCLIKKGYAYRLEDGVYYDISKFKNYGKLARRTVVQAEDGVSRIDEAKGKRNKGDFCLWKFSKPEEPKWKSRWGWGRPGWHIEDTAITEKYFGYQYDIHGGGRDLIFPHHEAEIAQMEAISDKSPFVKYWLHVGFLTVEGQKMSKSLGNFITINEFLKENTSRLLRFIIIKNHYRSPIDYSEKMLLQAKKELERMDEFIDKVNARNLKITTTTQHSKLIKNLIFKSKNTFKAAMEDDFNTPKTLASIFEIIKKINPLLTKNKLNSHDTNNILDFLQNVDQIFSFIFPEKTKQKIPAEILKLVKKREKYRQERRWQKADAIREKVKLMGWWIEDTEKGSVIKKLK